MTLLGTTVFDGLSAWQFGAVLAAYALAFTIKGVFGYGAVPPMILMGSLVMPPHHAVLLAGLVNLASQGLLLPDGLKHGNRRLAGRMILFIVPALVVGVFVFQRLDPARLQLTVGLLLLAILLADGTTWRDKLTPLVDRQRGLFSAASAIIAGMLAGIVGAGAMIFLSVYLRTREGDRLAFRGTIILVTSAILVWRTVLLVAADLVTRSLLLEALLMLPLSAAFLQFGRAVARRVSNEAFFKAYRVLMITAAALLVVRGVI